MPIQTSIRLADGRQLHYFDERPGADRAHPDSRRLPPFEPACEVRHDALLDDHVLIASHRQGRTHLPPSDACPLCASTPGRPTEIPAPDYEVVAFENRFPSLDAGRCEVVCFTSDHDASFSELPPSRARLVLDALIHRTEALSARPDVEHVLPFENRGEEIGVTLSHPHGQVYAYPFVPDRTVRMLQAARAAGRCLVCSNDVPEELTVVDGDHVVAFVPFAARFPFELQLVTRRHVADLTGLEEAERDELARTWLDLLGRLDRVLGARMPYVAAWQQAPVREGRDRLHLFLHVLSVRRAPDRLKYLAGSELAAGAFINDIAPEHAAAMLRDAG